ncbi:TetR family transcriptional regulator [Streptomyces sp. MCAF7]
MAEVKGKRGDKARETRRRIIDAAAELFVEQGYGATKLQEIADRGHGSRRSRPRLPPSPPWPHWSPAPAGHSNVSRPSTRWSAPQQRPTRRSGSCGRTRPTRDIRSSRQPPRL